MSIVATPFDAVAFILIAYFLLFLNLKSVIPYATVASLPSGTYDVINWWFLLSTISRFAFNTALYNVEDIWHIPPPIPSTTAPFSYTFAVLYPAAVVLAPSVLLYENVSPGNIILSFIFSHAISKLVDLFSSPPSYLVVYVLNLFGNASDPKSIVVTLGFVIFSVS